MYICIKYINIKTESSDYKPNFIFKINTNNFCLVLIFKLIKNNNTHIYTHTQMHIQYEI